MHCKNWKTILPFAITFLVGVWLTDFVVENQLRINNIEVKTKIDKKKEVGGSMAIDKAPTMIDCLACIDGKIYKEDKITHKFKPTNKFEKPLFIISKAKADYTDLARTNQIQGKVILRVAFLADGTIGNIAVIESLTDGLTEQAIEAAKKIEFKPAIAQDGRPVSVTRQVQYTFTLY